MDPWFLLKTLGATAGGLVALVTVFGDDITFNPVVSLTTIIVTLLVTVSLAYTQSKSKSGAIYREEAEAERLRVDRIAREKAELQSEKDTLGSELVEAKIMLAKLEERPDLTVVVKMVEQIMEVMRTQAHSGHELSLEILERIQQHDQRMMQLHDGVKVLLEQMQLREQKYRREDTER